MQCSYATLSVVACPAVQHFSTFSHKRNDFPRKKKVIEHKMCGQIFSTTFVCNIFNSKKNWVRYDKKLNGLHVKYPLFFSDFNKTLFSRRFFGKFSNINFHENSSSASRVVPYGQTDRHDETNNLFRNFANASKNKNECLSPTAITLHSRNSEFDSWLTYWVFWVNLWPFSLSPDKGVDSNGYVCSYLHCYSGTRRRPICSTNCHRR